ncbi:hypothetical protein B296_00002831 [Ensete ventricosum]|uniref:Uncharacterized protein n=1 Tax=Ensete ventricosum TaxID=4639 RepID=A0A427A4N4_ENSVE|nr:hypothetical protein B296_00002831 [Ensete ventricosum]
MPVNHVIPCLRLLNPSSGSLVLGESIIFLIVEQFLDLIVFALDIATSVWLMVGLRILVICDECSFDPGMKTNLASASACELYSSSPDLKVISGSRSHLDLFSTIAYTYALRAKELSPPEVGPPMITSICFSLGLFRQGEESLVCRPSGSGHWS